MHLLPQRVGAHEVAAEIADDLHVVRHDHPRLLQLRQLERLVEIQPHAQRHAERAKDAAATRRAHRREGGERERTLVSSP